MHRLCIGKRKRRAAVLRVVHIDPLRGTDGHRQAAPHAATTPRCSAAGRFRPCGQIARRSGRG
ncbi:hypothetical protein 2.10 [Burkholderia phage Bups phi1]|nr:hypothetical protein 2.10 [Burkholderia phage Bups phi1]